MSTPPSHVILLANPAARSGAGVDAATRAAGRLRAAGIRTSVVMGDGAEDSTALLGAALDAGADAVVAAGGDGTVHLTLQQLAGRGIPLGILPLGTGNDLATTLELPAAADAATDVIIRGRTRSIDLARVEGADGTTRFYATVLAAGFDSKVNVRANAMRRPRGRLRYDLSILIEFALLRSSPFRLSIVDERGTSRTIHQDALLVAVGNGRSYGGGIPICPAADPADGLLEVTVVEPAGRARLVRILARAYRGTHVDLAGVSTLRVRRIDVDAPDLTAYADGEPLGALPLRVEAVPDALRVFVP